MMYNTIMLSSQNAEKRRYAIDDEYMSAKLTVAGVDEAGRGPWAGPVVAAAVVPDELDTEYADSKALSPIQRNMFFSRIVSTCSVGVGIASPEEVDILNVLNATRIAVVRAVDNLGIVPERILIDGKYLEFDSRCRCIVSGDRLNNAIAAASIVAKVVRDSYMSSLSIILPGFSFFAHKGYGTPLHRAELKASGPTPWHRLTYSPVRELITPETIKNWLSKGLLSDRRHESILKKMKGDSYDV